MEHIPPLPIETQINIGLLPIPLEIAFIIKDMMVVDQRRELLERHFLLHIIHCRTTLKYTRVRVIIELTPRVKLFILPV